MVTRLICTRLQSLSAMQEDISRIVCSRTTVKMAPRMSRDDMREQRDESGRARNNTLGRSGVDDMAVPTSGGSSEW